MTGFPKKVRIIGFPIVILLVAALFFIACQKSPKAQSSASVQAVEATNPGTPAAKKPTLYSCPMHPTYTSDKPGVPHLRHEARAWNQEHAAAAPAAPPVEKEDHVSVHHGAQRSLR